MVPDSIITNELVIDKWEISEDLIKVKFFVVMWGKGGCFCLCGESRKNLSFFSGREKTVKSPQTRRKDEFGALKDVDIVS